MNTGCEFYTDALVDLARGELEAGRAERVEAHLATCEDCREALEVIRAVRGAPAPVPADLKARILAAVQGEAEAATPVVRLTPRRPRRSFRPWALPVAVAAALAIWVGASELLPGSGDTASTAESDAAVEYGAYGAWPGSDGVVAGDVVLSQLSVEELEALLEEMQ